jgi:hypothetical protein
MMLTAGKQVLAAFAPWVLPACAVIVLGWILSRHSVWLPLIRRHRVMADILIILGCSWFIAAPLAQPGAPGGHDLYFHTSRVAQLQWLMRDGVTYGRWTPDFNYGFGYPLLNFYPPLIYYLAQPWRAVGVSVLASLNWVSVGGLWLSGVAMYLLGKEFWGRHGGVVCAVAYLYAPYRIVNLYVRGAIPELFAMTFMPLVIWSAYKLVRSRYFVHVGLGALAYGFMIAAHNVTALFFSIVLGVYIVLLLGEALIWPDTTGGRLRPERVTALKAGGWTLVMVGLGIGLSSVYWLPAMAEKQFVTISSLHTGYHDVALHFVYPAQLFSRFWGYGGSGPGPHDGMSFQLGLMHVGLAAASALLALLSGRATGHQQRHVIAWLAIIGGLLFAMTASSLWIWRMVPLIGFISFPWRLLSLTALALSWLCGGIFLIDFGTRYGWGNRAMQGLLIGAILAVNVGYCRPGGLLPLSDEHYTREMLRLSDGAALNSEYVPIWSTAIDANITPNEIQLLDGKAEVEIIRSDTISYTLRVQAATPATFRIGMLYFPGWMAYYNSHPLELVPEPLSGLLKFSIPAGTAELLIRFEDTRIRTISAYGSLASLGVVGILLGVSAFKRRR